MRPKQRLVLSAGLWVATLAAMIGAGAHARAESSPQSGRLSPTHPVSVLPLDLRTAPAEEALIAAGQLGGPLFPTHELKDRNRDQAARMEFGKAMDAWNRHEYRAAVELLRKHVRNFPDSPWAAEANLHVGCDATYNGRYTEAETLFTQLITEHQGQEHPGAKMLANKARQRLALLKVEQNNLPQAGALFEALLKESPDWRHRTYAAHWLHRLSRFAAAKQALLNCGAEALAYALAKEGRPAAAALVRKSVPATMRGHTLADLVALAGSQGYQLDAVEAVSTDLSRFLLPAILHIGAKLPGESGHYWVLDKVEGDELELFDPQSQHRFQQTTAELNREWSGRALVVSKGEPLPGRKLDIREMESASGGCCGAPRKEDGLGKPKRNGKKGRNNDPCSKGSPTWEVDVVSMNLFLTDTPLWYDPPIGPRVWITLSYNSQSAIAQHEPFGNKWQFNYGTYLVVDTAGTVTIYMPDGARDAYAPDGSGGYIRPYRVFNTLTRLAANHFELRFPNDTVFVYQIPAGTSSQQPFLTAIRDATGQQISFGYDSKVNLTTITDAQSKVTTLTYDANNHVTAVTDPFGRMAQFTYDSILNLASITDMGGYSTSFTYDANLYPASLTNERGTYTFQVEPADGITQNGDNYPPPGDAMFENYRITITDPLGGMEEFFYYGGCDIDGYGGCSGYTWYVSPRDYIPWLGQEINNYRMRAPKTRYLVTQVGGGRQGEIEQVLFPEGDTVSYDYDPVTGDRTGITDAHGHAFQFSFNALGEITSISDPKHSITKLSYAANGIDLTKISDGLGAVVMTYDSAHHMTSVTDRLTNTTYLSFNSYGRIIALRNTVGITNYYAYDANQQLATVSRNGQTICGLGYDSVGRVNALTNSSGLFLAYEYNNLDEVTKVTYPDGGFESYQYSTCCPRLVDAVTDRADHTARFTYDSLKRLAQVLDAQGSAIQWIYDANGNLLNQSDASGVTTTFGYDTDDRLTTKTFADGHSVHFGYDVAGLLTSRTNASGAVTTYAYDPNHNLAGISYSDGTPGVTNTFDSYNRLTRVSDGSGATLLSVDANSRITTITGPWADESISLNYDPLDRVTNLLVQGSQPLAYTFDAFDRLSSIRLGNGAAFNWSYAGASPFAQSLVRPNSSSTTNAYDFLNRLTLVSNRRSSGAVAAESRYTYDSRDRCVSETLTNNPTVSFAQNQLVAYRYTNANQLASATPPNQAFAFDADGNLSQGYTPAGTLFAASYDAENRLKSLSYTNTGIAHRTEFTYSSDFFVARRQDYVNGALSNETRFARLGGLPLQERDGANGVARDYVWCGNRPGGIGELLQVRQGGQDYQCLYDGRGNVVSLLDASQSTVESYDYDPFGAPLAQTGSIDQPMRFCTKAYDENTGLLDYGYRFYAPALGRWLNRDPAGERGGLNLYQYAGNNPLGYVDPLGLWKASASGYAGVGGSISIGQNPDGSWFFGGSGGFGTGGGVSYDPKGKMPGYRKTKGPCGQVSIGFVGEAGVGMGPVKFKTTDRMGVNIASSSDTIIDMQEYSSDPVNIGQSFSPKPGMDIGAGVNYGLEVYVSED